MAILGEKNMSENKKPHIHSALMMQYAQDAMETEAPWERWEVRNIDDRKNIFVNLDRDPCWYLYCEYRRKPKTININGFEVPEPERKALKNGTFYYFPSFHYEHYIFLTAIWDSHESNLARLKNGLVHLTQEAAIQHAQALLSFTKAKE
jgi:hypothetical protein